MHQGCRQKRSKLQQIGMLDRGPSGGLLKPSPHCNDAMIVMRAREASTSRIRNPSHCGNQRSQEVELPAPSLSSTDQHVQTATLVQQVQTLTTTVQRLIAPASIHGNTVAVGNPCGPYCHHSCQSPILRGEPSDVQVALFPRSRIIPRGAVAHPGGGT